ncbi:MAG TPA: glycosyltransferase family 39 protein [Acidimicrobiales bacterium]|nr:glycosyltransferase family 39 protein [Acidimicrobiales bacterium]
MSIAFEDTATRISLARRPRRPGVLRQQLGTASAQWVAGLGNLAFALVVARVLTPAAFAEVGAFLGAYVLLHLPAAGIGAGAAASPHGAASRRRRLAGAGAVVGLALALAAPILATTFGLSEVTVLALAAAAPGAALLGLERGAGLGTGGHGRVAAGLVAEPSVRLLVGVAAAAVVGAPGAAVAVTLAGYAALAATWSRRSPAASAAPPAPAVPSPKAAARTATAVSFALFAVLQQQDLLVAKARLAPAAAGSFAMVSTVAGAVAFATATIPLVVLGRSAQGHRDGRLALVLTAAIGIAATVASVLAGTPALLAVFGPGVRPAADLLPAYVAAMALLGVGRLLAAERCADGHHRRVLAAAGGALALHVVLLVAFGGTAGGVVAATTTATATGAALLALPVRRPGLLASAVAGVRRRATVGDLAGLTVLVAVAVAVRFVSVRGLWVDEAITVDQAQRPFGEMLDRLRSTDVHPPLHHVIVWLAVRAGGSAEWVVRGPSVIAGAVLVPVTYGLGRSLYGRRTGLVAAALVTVAPFLVWYSQEARMYSLFVLLATVASWALAAAIRGGNRWCWAAWAIATAAMLWTQWFGVLPLGLHLLALAAAVVHRRADRAERWRLVLGGAAGTLATAVLVLPLVPFALDQIGAYAERSGALASAAPSQAGAAASSIGEGVSVYAVGANALWAVLGYHSDAAMTSLAALWPLLLLLALGALGRGRAPATTALVVGTVVPTLLFVVAGMTKRDLFELRYFAFVVPLVLLLVARTITKVFERPASRAVAAAAAVAVLSVALADQQLNGANPRRYDFESALDHVAERARPGDVVLYEPEYLAEVVGYYAPGVETRPAGAEVPGDATVFVLATTRVMDETATAARVGHVLAALEHDGRRVVDEVEVPNVRLWELR